MITLALLALAGTLTGFTLASRFFLGGGYRGAHRRYRGL